MSGKKSRGSFEIGSLQERDLLHAPAREAQLDVVVGAELEVLDGLGAVRQQRQEFVEALRRRVVGAGRADHVQALETEFGLERAQRVHLAGNADDREAPMAAARAGSSSASSGAYAAAASAGTRTAPAGHRVPAWRVVFSPSTGNDGAQA